MQHYIDTLWKLHFQNLDLAQIAKRNYCNFIELEDKTRALQSSMFYFNQALKFERMIHEATCLYSELIQAPQPAYALLIEKEDQESLVLCVVG